MVSYPEFDPPIEPRLALLPLSKRTWSWKAFERFCLDVVKALPDVVHAEFYGAEGDRQDGIDILADLCNGGQRTYQCKKKARFGPAAARATMIANTYEGASEHVLLVACSTSIETQKEIRKLPRWRLLDQEGISSLVRTELDREAARRIVDDHLGAPIRRAFLGPSGPRTFIEPELYFRAFTAKGLFRHNWTLTGRDEVLSEIEKQLASRQVVVLPGRGGSGKTRLLRALADRLRTNGSGAQVLFVLDDVTITPEAVEDLPLGPVVVVVDDAHQREDLGALIAAFARREAESALLLATRPQRLEELRGSLARAGLSGERVHVAPPLADLSLDATEVLALEALGGPHSALAPHARRLAEATADCPLVTVVGGQLLALRKVEPEMLEHEQDFRDAVLSRWEAEIVGDLSPRIEPAIAQQTLRLLAALAPLSVADGETLTLAAADIAVTVPELLNVIGDLEQAGLVRARGRLRRIIPDVLADHILHRSCVDGQGRPNGYADVLVERYGGISFAALLRNLAELDWRIGQTRSGQRVLVDVWDGLRERFRFADAYERVVLLNRLRPAAILAPTEVARIIELALHQPSDPAHGPYGHETTDADVRVELPQLLYRVGHHPELTAGVMGLLWELGRDDERPLHSEPDHPIRLTQELGEYGTSLVHPRALLDLVTRLLADGEAIGHHWTPLELLRPLVARAVERTRMVGFGLQMFSIGVVAATTTDLRREVFELIRDQGLIGDSRSQRVAAELLRDALALPQTIGGTTPQEQIDQWHDEQLQLVALSSELIAQGPPLLRMEVRRVISWHSKSKLWPDIAEAAQRATALPASPEERMLLAFAYPLDLAETYTGAQEELQAHGRELAHSPLPDQELIDQLDDAVGQLQAAHQHANPLPSIGAMTQENPDRGLALARWLVSNPDRPLAPATGAVLATLRALRPSDVDELVAGLDADDVRLRRLLADYFQSGGLNVDPPPQHIAMMRRLLRDPDLHVRHSAVHALPPLTQVNPVLAVELALVAETSVGRHAEIVDHVLSEHAANLYDNELEQRLVALEHQRQLGWAGWQLLVRVGARWPERVVDLLITRSLSTEPGMRAVADARAGEDILSGFSDDDYYAALRRVRNAALPGQPYRSMRELGKVYWALDRSEDASLTVLGEWLTDPDLTRVQAAARLFDALPFAQVGPRDDSDRNWRMLIERPDFNKWLARLSQRERRRAPQAGRASRLQRPLGRFVGARHRRSRPSPSRRARPQPRDRHEPSARIAGSGAVVGSRARSRTQPCRRPVRRRRVRRRY